MKTKVTTARLGTPETPLKIAKTTLTTGNLSKEINYFIIKNQLYIYKTYNYIVSCLSVRTQKITMN